MTAFGTAGIRGDVITAVGPDIALSVGWTIAEEADEVVIARDGRTTGPAIEDAIVAGLTSGGANVERLGRLPTPALAFASRNRMGLMVTASHNPPSDNGIKVFQDGREIDRPSERRIERRLESDIGPVAWDEWGRSWHSDGIAAYLEAITQYLRSHGSDAGAVRVALDCGNGTGGLVSPAFLTRMGADVCVLNGRVDGRFPARGSEPTPHAMKELCAFVAEGPYDLGVAHDGDADRVVIVDQHGDLVHEDTILAILAHYYIERATCADPVVVTTPNASTRIDERVSDAGGRVTRTALGKLREGIADVQAQATMGETAVVFAGEPWKHLHPACGPWIDGIVSAGLIVRLAAEAGGLDSLRDPVTERPSRKRNIECEVEDADAVLDQIRRALAMEFPEAQVDAQYGVRLSWPAAGWVLVRPSGTEPKMRIYAEHPDVDGLLEKVIPIVRTACPDT